MVRNGSYRTEYGLCCGHLIPQLSDPVGQPLKRDWLIQHDLIQVVFAIFVANGYRVAVFCLCHGLGVWYKLFTYNWRTLGI